MTYSAVVLRQLATREAILGQHTTAWAERRYQDLLAEHGHAPSTADRPERTPDRG